jgi:hypothetical protein
VSPATPLRGNIESVANAPSAKLACGVEFVLQQRRREGLDMALSSSAGEGAERSEAGEVVAVETPL